jgi:hypothetical protein
MESTASGRHATPRYPVLVVCLETGVRQIHLLPQQAGRLQLVAISVRAMDHFERQFRMCAVLGPSDAIYLEPDGNIYASSIVPTLGEDASLEPSSRPATLRPAGARVVRRRGPKAPVPERKRTSGKVRITKNQLALLQGLLDRPRTTAASRIDFTRAAYPHLKRFREHLSVGNLYHAIGRLPARWVERKRVGNRIEHRLSPRGRAIVEGRVPAAIDGVGPYAPRRRS